MIILPHKLNVKLNESSDWSSNVNRIINNVSEYLMRNPFFFPEYTMHGEKHINNVLAISSELIPDQCMENLKSRDISLLVISIITHDIGMFIEKEGVHRLIYGNYASKKTSTIDNSTWKDAWEKYISKIRRCPDKMLVKLFGSATQIQLPTSKMDALSYIDILVYGEFLRQFHPRISQEIVLSGFIGTEVVDIFRGTVVDDETRGLIGLLVRSHGFNIRDANLYLNERFISPSKPKGIPIYYLMSILRIADYLDAGQGRAPKEIQLMKSHISPISRLEWDWNQSIDYQDYTWDKNKEILIIHSNPQNTIQFTSVEKWLIRVQHETDLCWAVLGEYYGNEKKWLLTIRRINSNVIDNKTKQYFEKKFLTQPAALSVNPDILKLLIGPLYNNNPSCGIREIVQNAVDACRERYAKEASRGNLDYKGKIIVKIDSKNKCMTVSDNGIGMTSDTLVNYYLMAGSSYRYSDNWTNDYVVNEKSTIPRTGKFGIGVLSAFLLGTKMHVETRHLSDDVGLVFELELNDSIINVTKSEGINVGTNVRIHLTDEMLNKISSMKLTINNSNTSTTIYRRNITEDFNDLRYDVVQSGEVNKYLLFEWYFMENPSIKYNVDEIVKSNQVFVPDEHSNLTNWFDVEVSDFASYKWTYDNPLNLLKNESTFYDVETYNPLKGLDYRDEERHSSFHEPDREHTGRPLFCNGIIIPNVTKPQLMKKLDLKTPIVSVIDNDNKLKISLDRNTCALPNARELYKELYKHFIAKLLLCPQKVLKTGKFGSYNIIYHNNCYTIENEYFLKLAGIESYYGIVNLMKNYNDFHLDLCNYPIMNLKISIDDLRKDSMRDSFSLMFNEHRYSWLTNGVKKICCENEVRKIFSSKKFDNASGENILDLVCNYTEIEHIYKWISSPIIIEYAVIDQINPSNKKRFFDMFSDIDDHFMGHYKEGRYNESEYFASDDDLAMLLSELLGNSIWIPIDKKERKEKYPYAFKVLKKFMNTIKF